MISLRNLPLLYKLPSIVVVLGILTASATGVLIVHDMRATAIDPTSISILEELWLPLLVSTAALCLIGFIMARAITSPLRQVGSAMTRVAKGEYGEEIPATTRGDEIGAIAGALASLRDDLIERETTVADQAAIIDAIRNSQGMIEFDARGKILRANQNLLDVMGYAESEIIGRQHAMFVEDAFAASSEYRKMWETLASGTAIAGTFTRVAKGGRIVYLQGAYSPVCDRSGAVVRVVKVASDVTVAETERRRLEAEAQEQAAIIEAISGGLQGMIEFDPRGKVLRANQVFLDTMGYTEAEAIGRMHSGFVEPKFAESNEYRRMWEQLANGEALRGTFTRVAKGGRIVYLQGTYSPVRDRAGKVVRVVKVASDVTSTETERLEGIEKRAAMEAEQARVVEHLSSSLAALAGGDLVVRIDVPFAIEYEGLRVNFNEAVEKLEGALSSVVIAAENIRNESFQVTQAADDLSHRTENQAAALEETAASLEELTASVRAAATGAEKASVDVASTKQSAEESGRIVRQAVDAMSEIEKSSQHISQIIGVIDDIAFQTNLLALNAGVEAARAGEAGRGFAVVASEVRALAQRSSDAAKEIKALISTSSQQVGRGVDLVGETGKSLQTIVESVTGITALIVDIANSSREQSIGLSEINTAINQLDQVTQQNAAMVEESTAASHAMKSEAESLSGMVAQFTTDLARAAGAPNAAKSARPPVRAADPRKAAKVPARPGSANGSKPVSGVRMNGSAAPAAKRREMVDEWQEF